MQWKNAEKTVAMADIVNLEQLGHHAGEVFLRQHNAFGFSCSSGSEDQRCDRHGSGLREFRHNFLLV